MVVVGVGPLPELVVVVSGVKGVGVLNGYAFDIAGWASGQIASASVWSFIFYKNLHNMPACMVQA